MPNQIAEQQKRKKEKIMVKMKKVLWPEIYHNIPRQVFAGLNQLLASSKGIDQAILSVKDQINLSHPTFYYIRPPEQ